MLRRLLLPLLLLLLLVPTTSGAQAPPRTLGAGPTATILPTGVLVADGSVVTVAVVVTDASGAPATGVRFEGSSASLGRLDPACPSSGPGVYSCRLTTPTSPGAGSSRLSIKARLADGTELLAAQDAPVVSGARARVTMSANPSPVVLTRDAQVNLLFTVTDPAGRSVGDLDLRLTTTAGVVGAVTPAGAGSYTATFTPPAAPFPQVALVTAYDAANPDRVVGFFSIPMIGKVAYPVDAGMPGVTLTFTIAGRTFPPAISDASGRASVPIEVPPGVGFADVQLRQPGGATSEQRIDLRVPPFARVALGPLPEVIVADGVASAPVRVFVVDANGRPLEGQTVALAASSGSISAARSLGGGVYEATFVAPNLQVPRRATITAQVAGDPAPAASALIGLQPPGPATLQLTADPAPIPAGVTQAALLARLVDPRGAPAAGAGAVFLTAMGPLSAAAGGPGVATATMAVAWDQPRVVQAIAALPPSSRPVAHLIAIPALDAVPLGQAMPVAVLSLDRDGRPVANTPVSVRVQGGGSAAALVQTDAHGVGSLIFTAGGQAGLATLEFSVGGARYTAPVLQGPAPAGFVLPAAGGQDQARLLARWRALSSTLTLGEAPALTVSTPAASPWGGGASDPWAGSSTAPTGAATGTATGTAAAAGDSATSPWSAPAPGGAPGADPWGGTGAPTAPVTSAASAARIEVITTPRSVPATGGVVSVQVRVLDAAGAPVAGQTIILLSNAGTLSGQIDNGDGSHSALLSVPASAGLSSVQLTATRPQGDLAAFANIVVGAAPVAAAPVAAAPVAAAPTPSKKQEAPSAARLAHRFASVWFGWSPGAYRYDGTACVGGEGCQPPSGAEQGAYDFLPTEIRAPTLGSFTLGGEIYPARDLGGVVSIGARATYTRLHYLTDFGLPGGDESRHCSSHFCDDMNFLNVDFQTRLAFVRAKGPLDAKVRVGYALQDMLVFRRIFDEESGERPKRFQTMIMHGIRVGLGLEYTVIPQLRPHVDYNMTLNLRGQIEEANIPFPGLTNHNANAGLSVFPVGPLLIDISYDFISRAATLAAEDQDGVLQRGRMKEQAHGVRLSAGVAF